MRRPPLALRERVRGAHRLQVAEEIERSVVADGQDVAVGDGKREARPLQERAEAIKEYSPFYLYFVHTLWHHGSLEQKSSPKGTGYLSSSSLDYIRPENRVGAGVDREGMQKTTMADIERKIDNGELAWGSAKDVGYRLIEGAERMGSNNLLLNILVPLIPWLLIFFFIWFFVFRVLRRAQTTPAEPMRVIVVNPPGGQAPASPASPIS